MLEIIVEVRVREELKKQELLTGSAFLDELRKKTTELVNLAAMRAKSNGRKTVQHYDL